MDMGAPAAGPPSVLTDMGGLATAPPSPPGTRGAPAKPWRPSTSRVHTTQNGVETLAGGDGGEHHEVERDSECDHVRRRGEQAACLTDVSPNSANTLVRSRRSTAGEGKAFPRQSIRRTIGPERGA
jgi:hypothetical protein